VGGVERWREARAWPLPEVEERVLYLHSGGSANSLAGDGRLGEGAPSDDEPADRFTFDPSDPVPAVGGSAPADQRAVEARADVLCYTAPPLSAPLEVTGRVRVVLFAASSAPDTDFTAKLVAVDGQGAALDLCHGILRCRRRGGDSTAWLEADRPQRLEIDLWATSWRLAAGDRIRLEISSSNFPRFDRNSNTRVEPGRARPDQCLPARQTVYHEAEHPSHAILPVAP
jgi:putative CocE/NonD family hydrolase